LERLEEQIFERSLRAGIAGYTSGDWMLVITKTVGIYMLDFLSPGTMKITRMMRVNWR
jgi:hypothetical protein